LDHLAGPMGERNQFLQLRLYVEEISALYLADVHDDIELLTSLSESVLRLEYLHGCGVCTMRKSYRGARFDLTPMEQSAQFRKEVRQSANARHPPLDGQGSTGAQVLVRHRGTKEAVINQACDGRAFGII